MVNHKALSKIVDGIGAMEDQISEQLNNYEELSDELRLALTIASALLGKARGEVRHAYVQACLAQDELLEKGWEA